MGKLRELRQLWHQAGMAEKRDRERPEAWGRGAASPISAHVFSVFLYPSSEVRKTTSAGFDAGGSGSVVGGISARMAAQYGAGEQGARLHYSARQHAGGTVPAASRQFCRV